MIKKYTFEAFVLLIATLLLDITHYNAVHTLLTEGLTLKETIGHGFAFISNLLFICAMFANNFLIINYKISQIKDF